MLNIHDLERRWLKYKIKKHLPKIAMLSFALFVVTISTIFMPDLKKETKNNKQAENNNTKVKSLAVKTSPDKAKKPTAVKQIESNLSQPSPIKQEEMVLKPSLHFMDAIEEDISEYIEDEQEIVHSSTQNIKHNIPDKNKQNSFASKKHKQVAPGKPVQSTTKKVDSVTTPVKPIPKKKQLQIITRSDTKDLKDVIRRFKKNKNPALSLFIAKKYYDAGEYQKSYNYALMTNEIDKKIDKSWIIFSKSLVKLGQKELAINTLKAYLKTTKSTTAEVLLNKIKSGSFK